MRTAQRDQSGLTTFTANIVDAPSGAGVANGVQFVFVRAGNGVYDTLFDTRLFPVTVLATASDPGATGNYATGWPNGPGKARSVLRVPTTNAAINGGVQLQVTALDRR